ncbi:adenosylcobinamide-phosphate synthase CbiB [Bariatricus massiliensis]|uniref:adenosylcobinamide-phosphate synthase CbiB n=1 Tax=Bariatricus massiliensis TaxID=1745713 RepID=UPI0008325576|nr:adenosylcobinamide-phosphate synthase CbiB [Bariatricus massiliensis]
MRTLLACMTGFALDLLWGDPRWLYHPVRISGAWISLLEKGCRAVCKDKKGQLLVAGGVLWLLVVAGAFLLSWLLLRAAEQVHPAAAFALESFWCYQLLACKSLREESGKVYQKLAEGNLPEARKAVSMIVGRDTERLTEEGVVKAAVETVAENTSDGVVAPLFYLIIGGAPLGFFYKAVNTMDSMIGYKDEKYRYLGRCAAKLDDFFNYIPARLSALLMIAGAFLLGMDGAGAWRIYRRDRKKHASPNAAQTEAVCAGALRIRLAGDAWYFGKLYKKEYIGDDIRPVETRDIVRAGRLLYMTAALAFVLFGGVKLSLLFYL